MMKNIMMVLTSIIFTIGCGSQYEGANTLNDQNNSQNDIAAYEKATNSVKLLSRNKPAKQSSTRAGQAARLAFDGNKNHSNNMQTERMRQPYLEVDLQASYQLSYIDIYNRNTKPSSYAHRLKNYYIFVSKSPFKSTNIDTLKRDRNVSSYHQTRQAGFPSKINISGAEGRYVRVQLVATDYLHITELEVFGSEAATDSQAAPILIGEPPALPSPGIVVDVPPVPPKPLPTVSGNNKLLSRNKPAKQSSTRGGQAARLAFDGNKSSSNNMQTERMRQPYLEVDLQKEYYLSYLNIYNRNTKPNSYASRLKNYYIFISSSPFRSASLDNLKKDKSVSSIYQSGQAGFPSKINLGKKGRYVRVQLVATDYLHITELEIFGSDASFPEVPAPPVVVIPPKTTPIKSPPKPPVVVKPPTESPTKVVSGLKVNIKEARQDSGHSYSVRQNFNTPADPTAVSKLRIFENGRELGPAHTGHSEIRSKGKGRFSHWKDKLYFSASDNTNPKTNGRTYTYLIGQGGEPKPIAETPVPVKPPVANPPTTPKKKLPVASGSYGPAKPLTRQSDPYKSQRPLSVDESLRSKNYNTTMTRISQSSPHHYSKRQAFNSNESLINLRGKIIDANSLRVVSSYQSGISTIDRNWSNLNPKLIYGVGSGGNTFVSYHLDTKKVTTIISLSGYSRCLMGDGEGNVTRDDRYVFLACSKGSSRYGLSVDLRQRKVLATLKLESSYNWGGFSQSGNYIIIQGFGGVNNRAYVYDKNLRRQRKLTEKLYHGDFGYDDKGEEVYVSISWDYVHYFRLRDGALTYAAGGHGNKMAGHGHISCRNTRRPGWCYISSNNGEVVSVKLSRGNSTRTITGSPNIKGILGVDRVEYMGFHRSSNVKSYNNQPKVTVSPSGKRVIFNSNWYGRITPTAFMIEFD